jgi:predicted exporter
LKRQEEAIRRLTGVAASGQFLLVQAPNTEEALRREEALFPLLERARGKGVLAGYQALAQFVPSMARQAENRALVRDRLVAPYLAAYYRDIGMAPGDEAVPGKNQRALVPADLLAEPALWFLSHLVVETGPVAATHLVLLQGATDPSALRQVVESVPGIRFIDPTGDVSRLLGEYRARAVALLAVSVVLMLPLLAWRYGARGSLRVALPSVAAVIVAPAITALLGLPFTFFNAMALVMVLSIGIDYAIFCREGGAQPPITVLGIGMAMLTTILSFGLLAVSSTAAVQAFGLTMLFGILLAFLLAPFARVQESGASRSTTSV